MDKYPIYVSVLAIPTGAGFCSNLSINWSIHIGMRFASFRGAYHGKFGFDEFSHKRAILVKSLGVGRH